jgi:hypothetical protein
MMKNNNIVEIDCNDEILAAIELALAGGNLV